MLFYMQTFRSRPDGPKSLLATQAKTNDMAVFHGIPHIPGSKSTSDDSMKKRQNSEKARQRGTHPEQEHGVLMSSL